MKQREKDSLANLLIHIKETNKDISSQIHWSTDDSKCLDDLMNAKELPRNIANRFMRATGSMIVPEYIPSFLAYKAWQRTMAVYSFNREFVDAMSQTEDTKVALSLLEHLPFKDMLFFFPEGVLPVFEEEIAGIYIHIEQRPGFLWILFNCLDRVYEGNSKILPGINIAIPITDGMKVSAAFETPEYQNWLSTYKKALFAGNIPDQKIEEITSVQRKVLNTAIFLMYYLTSTEPDIKPVKNLKKNSSKSIPSVTLNEVGKEYEEIVYRRLRTKDIKKEEEPEPPANEEDGSVEEEAEETEKIRKKRRPHIRRAHYQHYWIGKDREKLVVRWKEASFVGAYRKDQAIIVYDMPKESAKGKKNPNTSRKKRK